MTSNVFLVCNLQHDYIQKSSEIFGKWREIFRKSPTTFLHTGIVKIIYHKTKLATWRYDFGLKNISFIEIFFNTQKEISFICAAMQYPLVRTLYNEN